MGFKILSKLLFDMFDLILNYLSMLVVSRLSVVPLRKGGGKIMSR